MTLGRIEQRGVSRLLQATLDLLVVRLFFCNFWGWFFLVFLAQWMDGAKIDD
jgi:hypothetical protein